MQQPRYRLTFGITDPAPEVTSFLVADPDVIVTCFEHRDFTETVGGSRLCVCCLQPQQLVVELVGQTGVNDDSDHQNVHGLLFCHIHHALAHSQHMPRLAYDARSVIWLLKSSSHNAIVHGPSVYTVTHALAAAAVTQPELGLLVIYISLHPPFARFVSPFDCPVFSQFTGQPTGSQAADIVYSWSYDRLLCAVNGNSTNSSRSNTHNSILF